MKTRTAIIAAFASAPLMMLASASAFADRYWPNVAGVCAAGYTWVKESGTGPNQGNVGGYCTTKVVISPKGRNSPAR